jgi:hypothetical protein
VNGASAIASVSAILKSLLEHRLVSAGLTATVGGDVVISVLPPDCIAVGNEEQPRLNMFLYHVMPHTGLRSRREAADVDDIDFMPLALDLHYVLTAYGAGDFQIELLLGYAVQIMHQTPALIRKDGRWFSEGRRGAERVSPFALPDRWNSNDDRSARMTVTPQFLSNEELSKLWSAFQARYRPSVAYKVSLSLYE